MKSPEIVCIPEAKLSSHPSLPFVVVQCGMTQQVAIERAKVESKLLILSEVPLGENPRGELISLGN